MSRIRRGAPPVREVAKIASEGVSPARTQAVLYVDDLTVEYVDSRGTARAVEAASFTIDPGEGVGLVGESGSGKTTLALSLLGLLPRGARVARGSIRVGRTSMVFQEPGLHLNPVRCAGDQVAEVIQARGGVSRRRSRLEACSLLERVSLGSSRIYGAYPHQLSGGEQQRVAIARALAAKPAALIADEPTASLDNTAQADILALLAELKRGAGLAVLLITHNPALLAGLAERVLVMHAGRIVEAGSLEEIRRDPLHPYTEALLGCVPDSTAGKGPLRSIAGAPPDPTHRLAGCAFEARCARRMPICATADPDETGIAAGRRVRCFHYVH